RDELIGTKLPRQLRPDQLVAFRIHGVTPEFVGAVVEAGYERAAPDEILALRIHGVTPEAITEMAGVLGRLPLETHVAFRIHGVTAERIRAANARSSATLSSDELIERQIRGYEEER